MGKEKYQRQIMDLFSRSPVVSYKSIERIVASRKKVKQYVKQLVRNLIRQGRIRILTKGYYTSFNDASLGVFCFQPAYLGLQDALSYHNLWEQETIPVIITTRKVRTGIRKVLGGNALIRHQDAKYFFGIEYSAGEKFTLPYSDIEKTLIDFVHFRQKITPELKKEVRRRIDPKKLNKYLRRYPPRLRASVQRILK